MATTGEVVELPRWRDDPKAYINAWNRRKRRLDPEFAKRQSEKARDWQLRNPVRNSWNQARTGAGRRSLWWELTPEEYEELVLAPCHYCGHEAELPKVNGVDRVANEGGYTPDNVVTACAMCNTAKNNHSLAEFLGWSLRVAEYARRNLK